MKKSNEIFKSVNENLGYVDLQPISNLESTPKADYETKFSEFLAEENKREKEDEAVKVDSKKVAKSVEEIEDHNYDYKDTKNLDNQIGQEVLNGVYFESKNNPDKSMEEIKEMVSKNLAKDGQYYIKNAAFGVEGLGYTEQKSGEVSGKYAASGYSDKIKEVVKESLMGGVITSGHPNSIASQQGAVINQMVAEEEVEESYDEFQRDDKGAKGVDKKDKGEEMAFGAGVAKGEKIEKKKAKKSKKESIDTKLAEIGKEAEAVKLEAQLDYLHEYIQEKVDRVASINEDENLSELIDKTKMKQMQREIKDLERKKAKMERIYEKSCGTKYAKKEMVDEVETTEEV
jgi:hypothetical protein